ncbi:hypothetical protein NDN08_008125 [Rhodosorus marinus]|uniref:Uncharacterized protein n=1 Tax=Rhodosorus marinus TaxID=101924 RepID=A0AAV8UZG9_9RHOD|nr:hypothetical protein NDN08_008125 [Rhodosorus marinus]
MGVEHDRIKLDDPKMDKVKYLLSQSKIFGHFMGKSLVDEGTGAPRRMTEAEEDALLLEAEASTDEVTRLNEQPANIEGKMRNYQVEGLNFLIGLYERGLNGILADEMGLGKTLQTISLLGFLRLHKKINGPHLVIVPKSTLGNWEKEIERWCPEISVVRFHGNQEERKDLRENRMMPGKFDVCLTSYEMVTKEKNLLSKFVWKYLIIDEAHRIKNENSILSQMVRMFESENRLLITGTPLQNNLRELWALLNFLLPDIFSSSADFDSLFSSVEGGPPGTDRTEPKNELVHQLHAVLRPFLIRRLKSDVETDLPPKKETVLYLKLTKLQEDLYRNILKKDVDAINFTGGDRVRLLNILMQLRKCCNHPYLFDGVEDRSLDPFGEHLVEGCGKLNFLDKLLTRLKPLGHRVLVFSQMTRVLDILEDYCCDRMRGFKYCRIDGSTDSESRDAQIEEFNRPGSDKFVFLLSTRAGGLGINLATADTVILYDSDWNPQADLQAMDRAHRIGQKKPVNVYRLISENTLEERVLGKAMQKLHLDSLVIQSGSLTESKKGVQKEELLDMIRYGADSFFKVDNAGSTDEIDLDRILSRGEEKTKEMTEAIKKDADSSNQMQFKLGGDVNTMYQYEGVDYHGKANIADKFFLDVGKRGRARTEDGYFRDSGRAITTIVRPKQRLKPPKEPAISDFMFCNTNRLRELYEEEKAVIDEFNAKCEEAAREGKEEPPMPEYTMSPEKVEERESLLKDGFPDWLKRDFNMFLRASERHGRDDLDAICSDMGEAKHADEVRRYAAVFWEQAPTALESWSRIVKAIEEGEARIARRKEIERSLHIKVDRYDEPVKELEIPYSGNKGRQFIEEEDRWLILAVNRLGYGRWEELKAEVRRSPEFRFNWFIKSRTAVELKRRLDILVRVIEKENEEIIAAEKAAQRKKQRQSLSSTRGKKEEGENPLKKLKHTKDTSEASPKGKKGKSTKTPKKSPQSAKKQGGKTPKSVKKTIKKRSSGPIDSYLTPKKAKTHS